MKHIPYCHILTAACIGFINLLMIVPTQGQTTAAASAAQEEHALQKAQRADSPPQREKRGRKGDILPMPTVIWEEASLIVARPTATTADIHILPRQNGSGTLCYAPEGVSTAVTRLACPAFIAQKPTLIPLKGLMPNTRYTYWLEWSKDRRSPDHAFQTQRAPGTPFQFIVQGDSHPERGQQHTPALYEQSLKRVAREKPDFFIALGDDFSVDTLRDFTPAAVETRYRLQREYLGFVGAQASLFLVNGNHEQAARCNLDGTSNNIAVWAQNARETYFAQPAPNAFYTGDAEAVEHIGLLRDYYAWTWGDALFVVIDPYWHSKQAVDNKLGTREKNNDEWNSTLGDAQYHWLKTTLASSKTPFKFVFTHHVLGRGRGGIECSARGEWGGGDPQGRASFAQMRPGWEMPIHQLLATNHVTILFQGHDHLFCKQERDGVIYQTCPLPAGPSDCRENFEAYRSGTSIPGSGFVRVTVQSNTVHVAYVKNILTKDTTPGHDGEIAFQYTIPKQKE